MNQRLDVVMMGWVIGKKRDALLETQAPIVGIHNLEVPGLSEGYRTLKEVIKIIGNLTAITR